MKKFLFAIILVSMIIFTACDPAVSEKTEDGEAAAFNDAAMASPDEEHDKPDTGENDTNAAAAVTSEEVSPEEEAPDGGYYGPLHVSGGSLVSESGEKVQLRGISTHGLSWFPQYVNRDMMKEAREVFGCNVFRLAMYTAEYNGYLTGDDANREALKELIDTAVSAAEDLNMYVIIDWHTLSDNNPLDNAEQAAEFFSEISEKYKDKEHVIYEICNEPNGDTSWQDVKAYAETVIPVIRENTDAVVLVGTPQWSQRLGDAAADPLAEENVMYTLHFYAATHKEELRQVLKDAAAGGLPVFVSEFGICDASGTGAIDEAEANLWMDAVNECGVSYVMWNLSNKDESSAMIKSGCDKVSGFTADDLSPAGLWFKNMNTKTGSEEAEKQEEAANAGGAEEADAAPEGLSAELNLQNSWQQGTDICYQYALKITNNTEETVSGWKAHIVFTQNVSVDNSWNGEFFTNGMFFDVSPAPYNAEIAPGASVTDIGFILKSGADLKAGEVSVSLP